MTATIPERLAASRTGGVWFDADQPDAPFVPWGALEARAARVAGGMAAAGVRPGDVIGVPIVDPRGFFEAFFGATLAGAVPVSLAPPSGLIGARAWRDGLAHAIRAAGVRWLTSDDAVSDSAAGLTEAPTLRAVLPVDGLDGPERREGVADRPALLQLTSGSTGQPEVVVVEPEQLDVNVRAFTAAIGTTADSVCASWLPLHHDMGLIGHTLGSLWSDGRLALQRPRAFLKRPASWLRTISRRRATISFAPNFAYALAARRVTDAELAGLDLSSWGVAGCGAEPIDPATLVRFARRFAPAGFRADALLPCYGLAEHTLCATVPPQGRPLVVSRGHVGCGRPFDGHTLRIVDPDGAALPDGEVGEIVLSGPSVRGGGPLWTGDLGFVEQGELFVCGRRKDLLIVRGANHHPHELERAAAGAPGVRPEGVAAFAVPGEDSEQPVVLVEREDDRADEADIRRRVAEATGLLARVVLVSPGTVPRTTSGKVRRAEARARFLAGALVDRRSAVQP